VNIENIRQVSEGLLAHLHLSHTQAAVMVDDPVQPRGLMVHIFDEQAAKNVRVVRTWKGLAVRYVKGGVSPQGVH